MCANRRAPAATGQLSLILTLSPGAKLPAGQAVDLRARARLQITNVCAVVTFRVRERVAKLGERAVWRNTGETAHAALAAI